MKSIGPLYSEAPITFLHPSLLSISMRQQSTGHRLLCFPRTTVPLARRFKPKDKHPLPTLPIWLTLQQPSYLPGHLRKLLMCHSWPPWSVHHMISADMLVISFRPHLLFVTCSPRILTRASWTLLEILISFAPFWSCSLFCGGNRDTTPSLTMASGRSIHRTNASRCMPWPNGIDVNM